MRNRVLLGGLTLLAITLCVGTGRSFYPIWFQQLKVEPACQDRSGVYREAVTAELSGYYRCVDERARLFLERDFAETKDLAKAFLTLLTAVLVASITFSEKIVDMNRSRWWSRGLMIGSWVMVLVAIASCGAGLALMAQGAGYAAYFPHANYRVFETAAVQLFIAAGLSFGGGLVALLVAGIVSLVDRHVQQNESVPPVRLTEVASEIVGEAANNRLQPTAAGEIMSRRG